MMINIYYWKTSDIKISTDSAGYMSAEHKWAGVLIAPHAGFDNRSHCRREAVLILRDMRDLVGLPKNRLGFKFETKQLLKGFNDD